MTAQQLFELRARPDHVIQAGHVVVHVPAVILGVLHFERIVAREADHRAGVADPLKIIERLIKRARIPELVGAHAALPDAHRRCDLSCIGEYLGRRKDERARPPGGS